MEADRFGMSDSVVEALATVTLIDVGMIMKDDDRLVNDRSTKYEERDRKWGSQ